MTLNGAMAVILRYVTKFGSFQGILCKSGEDIPKLSVTNLAQNF